MKYTLLLLTALTFLVSCGSSSKNSAKVEPEQIKINGALSDYLEIVKNDYEIADNFGGQLAIKIKGLKSMQSTLIENKSISLIASLTDKNDAPLSGVQEFIYEEHDNSKLYNLLIAGSGEIVINLHTDLVGYDHKNIIEKAEKFTLSSEIKEKTIEAVETTSQTTSDLSSSIDNAINTDINATNNYDQMISGYEALMQQYVVLMQKMENNDISAIAEYPGILKKTIELQDKLKAIKENNQMTTDQLSRFAKVEIDLLSSMSKMKGMGGTENLSNASSSINQIRNTQNKNDYSSIIRSFVQSEDDRNFSNMQNYLSSSMRRYWNVNNPSRNQILNVLKQNWNSLSYSSNQINNINKVNDNMYEMNTTYTYTTNKTGTTKTTNNIVHFIFDDYGKITEVY